MSMKKSWLNKGLILNDIKRLWWAIAVYCIGLIFFAVMPIFSLLAEKDLGLKEIKNCLFGENINLMIIGAGIGVSILVFSFMNRKGSSEFIYSLPLTKKTVFMSKYLAGLIMILIPIVISYSIVIVLMGLKGLYTIINIIFLIKAIFLFMFISILSYTITTGIGMFTSSSIATGIFTIVFLLLPSGLKVIMGSTLTLWIYGYTGRYYGLSEHDFFFKLMEKLNPITNEKVLRLQHYDMNYLNMGLLINFILCIAGYLIISYFLFNRRKSEAVGNMIVFKWFRPILKYGFTLCIMLTSLIILENGYGENGFGYKIGAYLMTSAIAYYFVTCFMEKSINAVFKKKYIKGIVVYDFLILLIFGGIWFNLFNVQNFQVDIEDVKLMSIDIDAVGEIQDITMNTENEYLIDEVMKFKDYIVENRNKYKVKARMGYRNRIWLNIYTEDGGEIQKVYYIDKKFLNHKSLQNLYLSEECKKKSYCGIEDMQDVNYITLEKGYRMYNKDIVNKIVDRKIIEEVILAIKEDVKSFDMEDLTNTKVIGTITICADVDYEDIKNGELVYKERENSTFGIVVTESYKNTIQKLKDNNLFKDIIVSEEDIEKIEILDKENGNRYIVTDNKTFIDEVLKSYMEKEYLNPYHNYDSDSYYWINIKFKNTTDFEQIYVEKKLIPNKILEKIENK